MTLPYFKQRRLPPRTYQTGTDALERSVRDNSTQYFFSMLKSIEYVGHLVAPGELHDARKVVDAVLEMKPPMTKTQLCPFLGM